MKYGALVLMAALLLMSACSKHPHLPAFSRDDSVRVNRNNLAHRERVDEFFRTDEGSPFKRDTSITYKGIKWYPVDVSFCVTSLLHRYAAPETVIVMGTRGEQRRNLKYGYFEFIVPDDQREAKLCRLNVYKFTPYDGQRYLLYRDNLSVWFTDRTTGTETYDVGRYVDVGIEFPDQDHLYEIDLNKAYNPYCAYSNLYSCAIPRKEDHLEIAVRAGEKKYHE